MKNMVSKRGKSRLSDSTKRALRFEAKYSVDPVTKRFKILLPVMYPQLETALRTWDYLEVLVFPKMEELGIPEEQYPFYMAWIKRKAEKGLMFSGVTQTSEYQLLKAEFVERGLDPVKLDLIEPFIDSWVGYMKSSPVVTLMAWGTVERNLVIPSPQTLSVLASAERNVLTPGNTISETVEVTTT